MEDQVVGKPASHSEKDTSNIGYEQIITIDTYRTSDPLPLVETQMKDVRPMLVLYTQGFLTWTPVIKKTMQNFRRAVLKPKMPGHSIVDRSYFVLSFLSLSYRRCCEA